MRPNLTGTAVSIGLALAVAVPTVFLLRDVTGGRRSADAGWTPEIARLRAEQLEAARSEWEGNKIQLLAGRGNLERTIASSRRILTAELELCQSKADRIATCESFVARAKEVYDFTVEEFRRSFPQRFVDQAKYEYLDAQILLERAKLGAE